MLSEVGYFLRPRRAVVGVAVTVAASALCLLAQSVGAPAAASAQGAPAKAKVWDSILGVRIGMTPEEVRARLKSLGRRAGEGEAREEDEAEERREGGRKETWVLKKSEFAYLFYKTDRSGRVVGVSGFVRQGREIPFERLGDLTGAASRTDLQVVWNVEAPGGPYQLIARGGGGRARVVQLLSLSLPPMQ